MLVLLLPICRRQKCVNLPIAAAKEITGKTPCIVDSSAVMTLDTLITGDAEYRSNMARQRWHWAFTKIVQVRPRVIGVPRA